MNPLLLYGLETSGVLLEELEETLIFSTFSSYHKVALPSVFYAFASAPSPS
jgi:hypothetical protein